MRNGAHELQKYFSLNVMKLMSMFSSSNSHQKLLLQNILKNKTQLKLHLFFFSLTAKRKQNIVNPPEEVGSERKLLEKLLLLSSFSLFIRSPLKKKKNLGTMPVIDRDQSIERMSWMCEGYFLISREILHFGKEKEKNTSSGNKKGHFLTIVSFF